MKPWEMYQDTPMQPKPWERNWGEAEPEKRGMASGIAHAAMNGATFGLGDEIAASGKALGKVGPHIFQDYRTLDEAMKGTQKYQEDVKKAYDEALPEERALQADFSERHPIINTVSEIGGAIANPVSRAIPVSKGNIYSKMGLGALTSGTLGGVYGFNAGEGGFEERAKNALGGAATGAALGAAIPVVAEGIKKAAKAALGFTTGVGADNINQALDAGKRGNKQFLANMRGEEDALSVVDDLRTATRQLKQKAQQEISAGKSKIADKIVDISLLKQGIQDIRAEMKVGRIDKLGSNKTASKVLENTEKMAAKLMKGKKPTVAEVDALKQGIGNLEVGTDGYARAIRTRLYNMVKGFINETSPEYSAIMKPYEQTMEKLSLIERELSANNKNAYTALGKLQGALRNNAGSRMGARQAALSALDPKAAQVIKDKIAGQAMSQIVPRGLTGNLTALYGVGASGIRSPLQTGLTLASSSPRLVGNALYGIGRGLSLVPANTGTKAALTPQILKALGY